MPNYLESAPTSTGIYASHLQRHQATLLEQQELAIALNTMMNATEPIPLEPLLAYRLSSMGLIQLDGNKARPSYPLYQNYFEQALRKTSDS